MSLKYILAIETSCDETSLALLTLPKQQVEFVESINSSTVISEVVSSQISKHAVFGGVVPEVGARNHAEAIHNLFLAVKSEAIEKMSILSDLDFYDNLDAIAVTTEPGLASALKVGLEYARSLSFFARTKFQKNIPVNSVNHLNGHVVSSFFNQPLSSSTATNQNIFPHLNLLVSGGNSQIINLDSSLNSEIVGKTIDDAAGECLDKIGRMLGLPHPGGVWISKIAGLEEANYFNLPFSMKNDRLELSYSGLKTAVRYLIQGKSFTNWSFEQKLADSDVQKLIDSKVTDLSDNLLFIKQVAITAQYLVIEQLVRKFRLAISKYNPKSIGLSGGVSANLLLREKLAKLGFTAFLPQLKYTGDNAVMIGLASFFMKNE